MELKALGWHMVLSLFYLFSLLRALVICTSPLTWGISYFGALDILGHVWHPEIPQGQARVTASHTSAHRCCDPAGLLTQDAVFQKKIEICCSCSHTHTQGRMDHFLLGIPIAIFTCIQTTWNHHCWPFWPTIWHFHPVLCYSASLGMSLCTMGSDCFIIYLLTPCYLTEYLTHSRCLVKIY